MWLEFRLISTTAAPQLGDGRCGCSTEKSTSFASKTLTHSHHQDSELTYLLLLLMSFLTLTQKVYDAQRGAQASNRLPAAGWFNALSASCQTYHATGEWGKRGMTLQELTHAFDAFNEDEERAALGFAGSEDCNRALAEPLSGVKTVFSDLDGLKPLLRHSLVSSSPPSAPNVSSRITPQSLQISSTSDDNKLGYLVRTSDIAGSSHTLKLGTQTNGRVDEDTIKPVHKHRQGLSAISLMNAPTLPGATGEPADEPGKSSWNPPVRPPSRLGFLDSQIFGDDD
ncbi:hypothetical protein K439DRAFT_1634667 [Ramaria rubella]|nr:hypothetical protein K439DRAFT_1634667 [Ramaria rubella]